MTVVDPGPAAPATGDGAPAGGRQDDPGASGADTVPTPAENR
jgi:hypothetical protein